MTYFGYFLYTSILRCHEMKKKTSNKAKRRRLVWNPSRRRTARLPQNPWLKFIHWILSSQNKYLQFFYHFFWWSLYLNKNEDVRKFCLNSTKALFLESTRIRPTIASYKINHPRSQETVKLDQVWLLLSSGAFLINILVCFVLFFW